MIKELHIKLKSWLMVIAVLLLATNYSYSQTTDPVKVKGKVTDDKGVELNYRCIISSKS
jgi:hypothetical protein